MANMNKKRAKKLNEEYVEPEIITISDICGGKIVKNLENSNFLTLNVKTSDDDIYAVAIPDVLLNKIKKEDVKDGKGGVRRSGLSETTEESKALETKGQADSRSDESQDQGTETQQETS